MRRRQTELDRLDQLTPLEHGVAVNAVSRQHVEVGDRDPPPARSAARHNLRIERSQRNSGIRRLGRYAVLRPSEQGMPLVVTVTGGAPRSRRTPVARRRVLRAEIWTARLL